MIKIPREYTVYCDGPSEMTPTHKAVQHMVRAYVDEHGYQDERQFRVDVLDRDGCVVNRYFSTYEKDDDDGVHTVFVYVGTFPKDKMNLKRGEADAN
jgi:hypothetical protein